MADDPCKRGKHVHRVRSVTTEWRVERDRRGNVTREFRVTIFMTECECGDKFEDEKEQ